MRAFFSSATTIPPPGAAATPKGLSNSPAPVPCRPTAVALPDSGSTISSRWLNVSATTSRPSGSVAAPDGRLIDRTPPSASVPL